MSTDDGIAYIDERAPKGEPPRGFRLIRASDLTFAPPRFLVRDYLEVDTLALIFGDPGCGKSFAALDMACSIASGVAWHGLPVESGPVIYIAGEGHNGITRRLRAWEIRQGLTLDDAPLYVSSAPAALCDPVNAAEVQNAVDEVAAQSGAPALVVIDTLARNFGSGDENSTQEMGQFIQAADGLRTQHQATVLLVHHTLHSDKTRARGAMALKGALDAEYRLDKDEDGVVRMEATKMKDAPPPEPLAFRLRTVELGTTDHEGREVTSAVLDATSYQPRASNGRQGRGRWQTLALEKLTELSEQRESTWVPMSEWRDAMREAGMPRQRTYDVPKALEQAGAVEMEVGYAVPIE